ncbi:tetratricopeptide repeat protein [Pseudomonas nicosulfuronedens]
MRKVIYANLLILVAAITVPFLTVPLSAQQLESEIQSAKEKGITLYNQYKAISAEPYLEVAAKAGDRESQYYLGESIRFNKRYMTPEAEKWYTAAAEQGDLYAMYRLASKSSDLCTVMKNCPEGSRTAAQWFELGKQTAKLKADKGDAEAMYLLYFFRGGDEWLRKSAEADFADANEYLATLYREGRMFYFPPWNREEKAEELTRKAAEAGSPDAMARYARILIRKKMPDEAGRWLIKCVGTGRVGCYSEYAANLSDPSNEFGFPVDYLKSYALMLLLLDLNGGGTSKAFAEGELPKIAAHLEPQQLDEAELLADKWKSTHPPLSYFPDKLGY